MDDIDYDGVNRYLGDLYNWHEITKREAERTVFIAEKVICLVNLRRLSENWPFKVENVTTWLIWFWFTLYEDLIEHVSSSYFCFSIFFIITYPNFVKQARRSCRKCHRTFQGISIAQSKKRLRRKKREDCIWVVAVYANAKTDFRKWNSTRMPKNALAAITMSF